MNINPHGFWTGLNASCQHQFDSSLADCLVEFITSKNVNSIVDFGCGMGDYVSAFRKHDINAVGFDGNPHTPELTSNLCQILDLSQSFTMNEPFDWVMSLEVGEHLPKMYEDIFIANLHNNNKYGIILSWAIKGQGGYGHFNEQNNDYIKSKICSLGYINDVDAENKLRTASTLPWFKDTIMIFNHL